jgi:hypothetical protein
MATTSKLQTLAESLPTDERKALYDRINRSLNLHTSHEQKIYHSDMPRPRRQEIMREEMRSLGLWDRFVFWLMRIVSRHEDSVVFLRFKLGRLRRTIRTASSNLVEFDENMALPELPERVYGFYRAVYPLIPMFRRLWGDSEFLERMVSSLLEQRVPDSKTELNQFMPMKEMQDLFMDTENQQNIRTEVRKRLQQYIDSIQPDMFSHLEAGLLPLYNFRSICLFPYDEFFRLFGVEIGYDIQESMPKFSSARVVDVEQYLERLYYGLYAARRIPVQMTVHPELLEYFVEHSEDSLSMTDAAGEPEQGDERRELSSRAMGLRSALRKLRDEVERIHGRLPLVEIIKYFREDPYYRFLVYMPRLSLRDYYSSSLTLSVMGQIEGRLADVRMGVTGRMITEIFDAEPPEFEFFRESAFAWANKLGTPATRYVKSLNVLYNYIRLRYFGGLHEFVQGLARAVSNRQRDLQSAMLFHASGLHDLMDKIHAYDESFSPDSDDGKSLLRMRSAMEKDASLQRSIRITLAQKDREARGLLEKGIEHVDGLRIAFGEVLRAEAQATETVHAAGGRPRDTERVEKYAADAVIAEYINTFVNLRKLLNQLIAMEEGH